MPPSHIELINGVNQELQGTAVNEGFAARLDQLAKSIGAVERNNPQVRASLSALSQSLDGSTLLTTASQEVQTKLQNLRKTLTLNYAAAYNPETGVFEAMGAVRAGINRVLLAQNEYLPFTSTLPAPAQAAIASVGVLAGVGVAGYAAWKFLKNLVAHPLITLGSITAIGTTLAGIRNMLPESMRAWIPSFSSTPAPAPQLTPDQIKTIAAQRQQQEVLTDQAIANAQATPAAVNATLALTAIQTEIGLIQSLQNIPAQNSPLLAARLKRLNEARAEMTKLGGTAAPQPMPPSGPTETGAAIPPALVAFRKRNIDLQNIAQQLITRFESAPTVQSYEAAFFAINDQRSHLSNIEQSLTGVAPASAVTERATAETTIQELGRRETALEQRAANTAAAGRALELHQQVQSAANTINGLTENESISTLSINGVQVQLINGALRLDGKEVSIRGPADMTVTVNRISRRGDSLYCEARFFGDVRFTLSTRDIVRMVRSYQERRTQSPTQPAWYNTDRRPFILLEDKTVPVNGTDRRIMVYLFP